MTKVWARIDRNLERWALLFFYSLLVITMAVEVVRREVFSFSSIWGEEIVRYSFVYLVWIGASAGVKERAHIRIDVLFAYLSNRTKTVLYIFGDIIMLLIAVLAVRFSFEVVMTSAHFGSVTDGLRISKVWALMAVPLGFTLVIIRLVQSMLRDFRDLRAGRQVYEGDRLFD